MQLSLVDEAPGFRKKHFLDVFVQVVSEGNLAKFKLRTIMGQQVPENLKVAIPSKYISKFPVGTIYKIDTHLVEKTGAKPYFIAKNAKKINRAIEYFEYNLKVQYGTKRK